MQEHCIYFGWCQSVAQQAVARDGPPLAALGQSRYQQIFLIVGVDAAVCYQRAPGLQNRSAKDPSELLHIIEKWSRHNTDGLVEWLARRYLPDGRASEVAVAIHKVVQ